VARAFVVNRAAPGIRHDPACIWRRQAISRRISQEFNMATVSKGDKVQWQTSQGPTAGTVTRKVTGEAKAGGHVAKASPRDPQYEVKSSKSGKAAIHKASALKKVR
jgi:hypothetical protein